MRKSQDIIGLPVIHVNTGKQLGRVKDLLFDRQQYLRGVLLESGGWVRRGRYIPTERIGSLGEDAVMVNSEADILPLNEAQNQWVGLLTGQRKLKGLPVMQSDGRELGMVEDVYFMEEMGTLMGYELSDGFINDLRLGRKIYQPDSPLTWGKDALITAEGELFQDV
ncbi:photosystem reaction center subunit H [Kroppenstedtia pulmonis]|uniref:Photosystem reaction center subunit H n=1 Tax=Kroppenstedtia pulmonis TaxID=1380685 RepID=A0A7D4BGH3_9BACL|nr:PRC-barrel domain-containing protein [Kroppenstedtia pulmonis]QKG85072.1 photosystem reaction center subunit H [Kroppenstedtia pulmonis]